MQNFLFYSRFPLIHFRSKLHIQPYIYKYTSTNIWINAPSHGGPVWIEQTSQLEMYAQWRGGACWLNWYNSKRTRGGAWLKLNGLHTGVVKWSDREPGPTKSVGSKESSDGVFPVLDSPTFVFKIWISVEYVYF